MEININKLSDQEAAILRETIAASRRIVICAHKSPDGDAIGSSLGWAGYLRSLGKEPTICVPDMIPDAISWLPGAADILRYDKRPDDVEKAFDKCLDSINHWIEEAEEKEEEKQHEETDDKGQEKPEQPEKPKKKPKQSVKKEKALNITWDKQILDTQEDVEAYAEALRQQLLDIIKQNKVIILN